LLNEIDVDMIAGDDDDECQMLGVFKPENLLYNLKKEIKIDRADMG
jgi:hypothetical protein